MSKNGFGRASRADAAMQRRWRERSAQRLARKPEKHTKTKQAAPIGRQKGD